MEGKVAWNSGLIKKDSAGLESMARKNSKTMKDKMEQGLKTPFVKSWWSEERKKKASDQKKKFFEKIRKNIQTEFFLKIELECHTQKKLLLTG